jgi:hypothetical protein
VPNSHSIAQHIRNTFIPKGLFLLLICMASHRVAPVSNQNRHHNRLLAFAFMSGFYLVDCREVAVPALLGHAGFTEINPPFFPAWCGNHRTAIMPGRQANSPAFVMCQLPDNRCPL